MEAASGISIRTKLMTKADLIKSTLKDVNEEGHKIETYMQKACIRSERFSASNQHPNKHKMITTKLFTKMLDDSQTSYRVIN